MNPMTEEADGIAELEKLESELDELLPALFDRLKQNYPEEFANHQSHDEYFGDFIKRYPRMTEKEFDQISSEWFEVYGYGSIRAIELYKGACLQLITSYRARNADPIDSTEVHSCIVDTGPIARALCSLSTMKILSAATKNATAGGIGRGRTFDQVKQELINLLTTKAPASGWKSKAEAIRAINEPIVEFVEQNNINLKTDALAETISRWAREDRAIADAFERHVNRKPKGLNGRIERPTGES